MSPCFGVDFWEVSARWWLRVDQLNRLIISPGSQVKKLSCWQRQEKICQLLLQNIKKIYSSSFITWTTALYSGVHSLFFFSNRKKQVQFSRTTVQLKLPDTSPEIRNMQKQYGGTMQVKGELGKVRNQDIYLAKLQICRDILCCRYQVLRKSPLQTQAGREQAAQRQFITTPVPNAIILLWVWKETHQFKLCCKHLG